MSQSIITGLTGEITLPSSDTQYISSVSLNIGNALLPTSRYGGNGWETFVKGLKSLNGQCVAFMSKGAAGTSPFALADASGSMTVLFDVGCSVAFYAVIGNVNIVGEYAGLNIVTFSFAKGDDAAPTLAWVVS